MRARPDADVILIPPIDQIVAAGRTRPGMIGNLVGRQARLDQPRLRALEHLRRIVLVGQGEGAPGMLGEELRAALDGELVERQVLAGEAERPLELGRPGLGRLAGPAIDQVERMAGEGLLRYGERPQRLVDGMLAAEEFQRRDIERLHAERHAIDAGLRQLGEAAGLDRGRVGLERDLDVGRAVPELTGALDQGADGGRLHQRGRAAAEEHRLDAPPRRFAGRVLQFRQQRLPPARLLDPVADMAVEVAVRALRAAERPVDVDAERLRHTATSCPPRRARHVIGSRPRPASGKRGRDG